jgi:hypothetical protein
MNVKVMGVRPKHRVAPIITASCITHGIVAANPTEPSLIEQLRRAARGRRQIPTADDDFSFIDTNDNDVGPFELEKGVWISSSFRHVDLFHSLLPFPFSLFPSLDYPTVAGNTFRSR